MHRRLLYLWVTGVLVLPLCWGNQDEEYDEVTPTPDYDYSATLDYIFYSNSSQPMDYSLFETIGEENENEPGNPRDEAAVIGQSCLVLILGLAAQQICRLA